MPATRHKFSQCGHKGFGVACRRCLQAEILENLATQNKSFVTNKKTEKPRKWTKAEMLEEAKRLRAPAIQKNKSSAVRRKEQISFIDSFDEKKEKSKKDYRK